MKKLTGFILILFVAVSCNSEKSNFKSDLEAANLKGRVWKIQKKIFKADASAQCPACGQDEDKEKLFVYTEKGNLAESTNFDDDGNIVFTSKYKINRQGTCTEIEKFSKNKLIGKEIYVLKEGRIAETRIIDDEGKTQTVYLNEYSGGVQTGGKVLNNENKVVGTFQNEYSKGLLSVQTEKDENGNVKSISKYTRNESNDITEYFVNNPALNSEYKFTINYEYDKSGNWIKQTQNFNGKIIAIVIRNITYFDDPS
jgi:hypothetical protein